MNRIFTAMALGLLGITALTACINPPPPPPPPPPPTPTTTLYQGDWTLRLINANNPNDTVSGMVAFSQEARNSSTSSSQNGKLYAVGAWDVDGINQKPLGLALMGAISTPLDLGLIINQKVALVATDQDGSVGRDASGRSVFAGLGRLFDAQGQSSVDVRVQLIQRGSTPTYTVSDEGVVPASTSSALFQTRLETLNEHPTTVRVSGASLRDLLRPTR